jgi:hypothetical protein
MIQGSKGMSVEIPNESLYVKVIDGSLENGTVRVVANIAFRVPVSALKEVR